MKFGYFVRPHLGGTYTLFRQLRAGLAGHGVDLQWVGLAEDAAEEPTDVADSFSGFLVNAGATDTERAAALIDVLVSNGFDGVFINVLADRLQMNVARYLPASMLRVMIVHNITPGTYAAARSIRDHVHAAVGVSQRCRDDLIRDYGFPPEWTLAIPNAIDVAAYSVIMRTRRPARLRLLYLGRIEDASKGVFWLPDIMDRLPASVMLTVAGDGPDLPQLTERLSRHAARVTILGGLEPERIPRILAAHDVLIMPSRFEGFGFTIVEAMAAGCVPVVSHIQGVTDTIVEHGVSGLLFPVGDWKQAAHSVEELSEEPSRLAALSRTGRERVRQSFDTATMANAYAALIEKLQRGPPLVAAPLPMEAWAVPGGFKAGLRTYIPRPVKNWLRVMRERF